MAGSPRPLHHTRASMSFTSVPEIPGTKAEPDLRHSFQREVADLLGRNNMAFPGAQPVSFGRRHLNELKNRDFYLCEKTDGIRCLLYCTDDGNGQEITYLIDRKNEFYFVSGLHFPMPEDSTFQKFHTKTIIDGELVVDRIPGGTSRLRFLVFDCLVLDGRSYIQKPFDKRIGAFDAFIYRPYKKLFTTYPDELQHQPFELKLKQMEKPYGVEMMFRDKLPNLPHGNDGLVFTCKDTPYMHGTDSNILKWKPAEENTVDFKLQLGDIPKLNESDDEDDDGSEPEVDYDAMPTWELLVFYGNRDPAYRVFAKLTTTPQEWEAMKKLDQPLDGRIIECYKDEEGQWHFKAEPDGSPRFRDDKQHANYVDVVSSVLESIGDAVSQEELIAAAADIHKAWKSRHPEEDATKRKSPEQMANAVNGRDPKRQRATPS